MRRTMRSAKLRNIIKFFATVLNRSRLYENHTLAKRLNAKASTSLPETDGSENKTRKSSPEEAIASELKTFSEEEEVKTKSVNQWCLAIEHLH